jgi:glycosyltransferase involved in cell wall biosynthesis
MDAGHNLPLVSAVIPTRNRPDLVCRAVRSALHQTYPNMEVVVVIDGYDPVTAEHLSLINNPRIRVVELNTNVGGSEARNIGIREACGDLVALLDDDDEWLPEKINAQYAAYLEHGSVDCIVVCNYLRREERDTLVCVRAPRLHEDISEYMFCTDRVFRSSFIHLPVIDCYFAHKDIFLATPFCPDLPIHQDWDWLLRTMSNPDRKMVVVDKPLAIANLTADHRVSRSTNWTASLQWADASLNLFTSRSYSGFITDVCMRRIGEIRNRIPVFCHLLKRCNMRSHLTFPQVISAIKWFFLAPAIRRSKIARSIAGQVNRQYTRINWLIRRLLFCRRLG